MMRTVFLLFTIMLLFSVPACVSCEDFREIETEIEELNADCHDLRNLHQEADKERKEIKSKIETLTGELNDINKNIQACIKKWVVLDHQVAKVNSLAKGLDTGDVQKQILQLKNELTKTKKLTRPLVKEVGQLLEKKKKISTLLAAAEEKKEKEEEIVISSSIGIESTFEFKVVDKYWADPHRSSSYTSISHGDRSAPNFLPLILHLRIANHGGQPHRIPSDYFLFSRRISSKGAVTKHYRYAGKNYPVLFGTVDNGKTEWFRKPLVRSDETDNLKWYLRFDRLSFEKDPDFLLNPGVTKTICLAFDVARQNNYKLVIESANGTDILDVLMP